VIAHHPEPHAARLLVQTPAGVSAVAPNRTRTHLLDHARDAVYSPDGTLIAFARRGDLWVANADGSGQRRLTRTPATAEASPAWLPGGRGIVYATSFQGARRLRLFVLPTGPSRVIAASGGANWSPTVSAGGRLAFVSDRGGTPAIYVADADGDNVTLFPSAAPSPAEAPLDVDDLSWSPDGTRLGYVVEAEDGTASVVVDDGTTQTTLAGQDPSYRPVWSPDGTRLAPLQPDGAVPTDWRVVPTGRVLYPNLVQRPPSGLTVMRQGKRWMLGFTSMVDNRGLGPVWTRANRPPGSRVMPARQLLEVAGGWTRVVEQAGELDFANAWPHFHWHFLGFERYELRSAGSFDLVVRDHKEGFCMADHYPAAIGVRAGPPRFTQWCEQYRPRAHYVEEGVSVGYTDQYPAFYEGQSLDVTTLPSGRYWLVHRANPDFHLRELRYGDNTASLLVRVTWPDGHGAPPRISTLRTCSRERC